MDAAGLWMNEARRLLDHIATTQMDAIAEAAAICADTIAAGGLVHLFGSGHSRIPAEEMFPRYGSYPGFHPIVELSMTFHTQIVGSNGQRQAMFIEGVEGLAEVILSNFTFGPDDAFIVFSVSGRSAVPVEIAMGARERGMPLIVVTSVEDSMAAAPRHPSGTRLLDQGDVVIDLGTPPGDALVTLDGLDAPVGPGSTLAYAAIVNEMKVRTAELLVAAGKMPPVLAAASVVGEQESKRSFQEAYAEYARRLASILSRP
jgi:uncharacterized phosphosugar-binding protein